MAYTILKTDGSILATVQDGTLNTANSSLGLPGRNYAGYGNVLDTNFVHLLENFANVSVPPNPIRGQLWLDTSLGNDSANLRLRVCPTDGDTNSANWISVQLSTSVGNSAFGNLTVTNNANIGNNLFVSNTTTTGNLVANNATINANLTSANILSTTANLTKIYTSNVNTLTGTAVLNGAWTVTGSPTLNANLLFANASVGIRCDNYMYANGQPYNPSGTYGNSNVASYLVTYNSNVGGGTATFYGTQLSTGANTNNGTIIGNWTLSAGSRLNSTYADLAERFESDTAYEPGTVVELGGDKEITAVRDELSEEVFGVISNSAGYVMNGLAGTDLTHPAVAVTGRVPVKVKGKVNKNDRLVSAGNGYARAGKKSELTPFNTIGRALSSKTDSGIGIVEAIVTVK